MLVAVKSLHDVLILQEEREAESIVGTCFRRNDLSQCPWDEFVGERTFGDSLREDRVGASDARANDERGKE